LWTSRCSFNCWSTLPGMFPHQKCLYRVNLRRLHFISLWRSTKMTRGRTEFLKVNRLTHTDVAGKAKSVVLPATIISLLSRYNQVTLYQEFDWICSAAL
jgi:hypothetical protein